MWNFLGWYSKKIGCDLLRNVKTSWKHLKTQKQKRIIVKFHTKSDKIKDASFRDTKFKDKDDLQIPKKNKNVY